MSQEEFAIALGFALIPEHREPMRKRAQKLFAITLLDLLRLAARFRGGFPIIDLRGYFDAGLGDYG